MLKVKIMNEGNEVEFTHNLHKLAKEIKLPLNEEIEPKIPAYTTSFFSKHPSCLSPSTQSAIRITYNVDFVLHATR